MTRNSVAVVVPAYNAARTISQALRSVLSQSHIADEVIIVDDGSSDGTDGVVRQFGSSVRLVRQQNAGSSAARNHGVEEARSKWIAFLDADDFWLPGRLEKQLQLVDKNPNLKWVAGRYERCRGSTRVGLSNLGSLSGDGDDAVIVPDVLHVLASGTSIWTSTVLVHRSALLELGGFDVQQRTSHDTDLWIRLGIRYPNIGFIRRPVAAYRMGDASSLTASAAAVHDQSWILLLERGLKAAEHLPASRAASLRAFLNFRVSQKLRSTIEGGRTRHARWLIQRLRRLNFGTWPWWYNLAVLVPERPAVACTSVVRTALRPLR